MISLSRRLLSTCLAAGLLATSAAARSAVCDALPEQIDPGLAAALNPVIEEFAATGFAGQVAIARDGVLIYDRAAGFADAGHTIPVTPSTLFQVSSISKYVTAILIMRAADEGRLTLDDPLSLYWPGTQIAARGTTIAELLGHTSGLGSSYAAEATTDAAGAIAAIDGAAFDASRRGEFHYANDGYDLLGILLEQLHGQPYESLARDQLFTPACIAPVGFWAEPGLDDPARIAQPPEGFPQSLAHRNYGMLGSAGLLITAAGLVALDVAVGEGSAILTEAGRAALNEPRAPMSLGQATAGAFLTQSDVLGPMHTALGSEDWGDNASLTRYSGCIMAIVTSAGPVTEDATLYRVQLRAALEPVLTGVCGAAP